MIVEYMGGMKLVARHRGLEVMSDQPEDGGGANTALTPTELFVASLGMCVAVYVLYFARRHEIRVEGMKLEVDYTYAEQPRRVGSVDIRIHMPQPVSESHRAALHRAAEQCLVHNSLRQPPSVQIAIMD